MDIWSIIIGLLGGFGINGVINKVIDYRLQKDRFKFETIYKKRIEVLSELYKKIDKTEVLFRDLMAPLQESGDSTQKEKAKKAVQAANEFLEYFRENKIYLNESMETKVNAVNKVLKDAWITFQFVSSNEYKDIKGWQEAWNKIKDDVPIISKEIRKEFREIMGIK